ncbi:MAG: MalM family protein [Desulfuromonadales bacterium]
MFLLILSVAFTGCAVPYETAIQKLDSAKSCCRDFSEFTFEQLPFEKPFTFDLDQTSPVYDFASGKSYFKAVKLPEHSVPYVIRFRVYAQGTTPDDSHIFYPKFVLLNDNFSIESEVVPDLAVEKNVPAAMKENFGGSALMFSGEITIRKTEQKYLLVLTTEKLLSSSSKWLLYLGAFAYSPFSPAEGIKDISHSPIGRIVLEVKGE